MIIGSLVVIEFPCLVMKLFSVDVQTWCEVG